MPVTLVGGKAAASVAPNKCGWAYDFFFLSLPILDERGAVDVTTRTGPSLPIIID